MFLIFHYLYMREPWVNLKHTTIYVLEHIRGTRKIMNTLVNSSFTILNDTSNVTDNVFAIFQKRLEQLNRTFHH